SKETKAPWAVRCFKSLWETSRKGASAALALSSNAEPPETNTASVVPMELLISGLSLDMGHGVAACHLAAGAGQKLRFCNGLRAFAYRTETALCPKVLRMDHFASLWRS